MHLQVCWDLMLGKKFFYYTQAIGWSVAVSLSILNITVTGVSFRFGPTCHINAHGALYHYWDALFCMAGIAALLTFLTQAPQPRAGGKHH